MHHQLLLASGITSALVASSQALSLASYVQPLIATRGGAGFGGWGAPQLNPGASSPFPGMRLGPDTTRQGLLDGDLETWLPLNHKSGYFGSDDAVAAFSSTHVQGAGDNDYGNIGVQVVRTDLATLVSVVPLRVLDYLWYNRSPFLASLDRTTETAQVGYYSVGMPSSATIAELTVSGKMAGVQRFSCSQSLPSSAGPPNTGPCTLVVDVCHSTHQGGCNTATVTLHRNASTATWAVEAEVLDEGDFAVRSGGVRVFWVGLISADVPSAGVPANFSSYGLWSGHQLLPPMVNTSASVRNGSLGSYVSFKPPAAAGSVVISVRTAVSWTSVDDAWANLAAEQLAVPPIAETETLQREREQRAEVDALRSGALPLSALVSFEGAVVAVESLWEALLHCATVTPVGGEEGAHAPPQPQPLLSDVLSSHSLFPPHGAAALESGKVLWTDAMRSFLSTREGRAWAAASSLWPLSAEERDLGDAATPALKEEVLQRVILELESADARVKFEAARVRAANPVGVDLTVFFTALFRVFCAPSTYSNDVGGGYLGFDGQLHTLQGRGQVFLSDLSLWDIYRTQAPLLSLLLPDAASNITASMLLMREQGGRMPRWPFANTFTGDMVAEHGLEVIVDCVIKGACNELSLSDINSTVMGAIRTQESTVGYLSRGYVAYPDEGTGSVTLEFALNDATVSSFASFMGDNVTAAVYAARAQNYRNTWRANETSMCPRLANGSFLAPELYVPYPFGQQYTEGDGAHYRFAVGQDVPGLIALFPSVAAFVSELQLLMANQTLWFGGNGVGTILPNPWLWNGNEPTLMHAWLFNWAGNEHAWRTQYWTRWLLHTYYDTTMDGLPGNDDYSTMSAWAVWAYLGLYPITATELYFLGSPTFANVTLRIPSLSAGSSGMMRGASARQALFGGVSGTTADGTPLLTIVAHNASAANIFAYAASANGVALVRPFVKHSQLFPAPAGPPGAGAVLEFWMTDSPAVWGITPGRPERAPLGLDDAN